MSDGWIILTSIVEMIVGIIILFLIMRRVTNLALLLRVPLPQDIQRRVDLARAEEWAIREVEFKELRLAYEQSAKELQQVFVILKRDIERLEGTIQWLWGQQAEGKTPPPPQVVKIEVKASVLILGIWPESNLGIRSEINAIAESGIAYVPMIGEVTKRSLLEAVSRDKPAILHIGAHAGMEGIELDDGLATVGWWRNVARRSPFLRLVVLNACATLSIVDALRDAGIPAVVGMRGAIGDAVSIEFVRDFYAGLVRGMTVGESAEVAMLSLSLATDAEMIVARDPDGWTTARD